MEYGLAIRQAWDATWRHRFLWLLGLLAGSSAGATYGGQAQWRTSPGEWPMPPDQWSAIRPQVQREAAAVGAWLTENLWVVGGVGLAIALLALALLGLSMIAQGGMARATADIAEGRTSSFGLAWSAGLRLVWRYVGLWALLVLAAIATALLVGAAMAAIGAALYVGAAGAPNLATLAGVLGVGALVALAALLLALVFDLLGVRRHRALWMTAAIVTVAPVALAVVVFGAAMSVVVLYAQRAIAVEDAGPVAALRSGWRLLRGHLGESALAWLIGLALGVAGSVVVAAGAGVVAAVLAAVGFALWSAAGWGAATVVYAAAAVVVALGVVLTLVAIVNTFFWNYWTIAYLRLIRPTA
jgi:hypothetical protein